MKQGQVFAAAPAIMLAAEMALAQQQWTHVGTQGKWQFVLVDQGAASDAEALKQVAKAVCEPNEACVVVFWSDETLVATKMPMTPTQQQAVVAQYFHNPVSGSEELLLKCQPDAPSGERCLR